MDVWMELLRRATTNEQLDTIGGRLAAAHKQTPINGYTMIVNLGRVRREQIAEAEEELDRECRSIVQ